MALSDIVRSGVALANTITASLQATVTHHAWTSRAGDGKPVYNAGGAGTSRQALVEYKQGRRWSATLGQEIEYSTKLSILGAVAANGASGRHEPIDSRDRFTTPDGQMRPIVDIVGLTDPSTNRPYLYEVFLA